MKVVSHAAASAGSGSSGGGGGIRVGRGEDASQSVPRLLLFALPDVAADNQVRLCVHMHLHVHMHVHVYVYVYVYDSRDFCSRPANPPPLLP